jgi:Xaa-Pro aminopeptidase
VIAAEVRAERLESLRGEMARSGVDLAAIAPTDNIRYLLGFSPMGDERACMLLVTATGAAVLMPSLNAEQAAAEAPELELIRWSDDAGPVDALRATLERVAGTSARRVAADPEMRADHLMLLQQTLPAAKTVTATLVIGPLREAKDAFELTVLQRSSDVADHALTAAFAACAPGVTELAVGDAVERAFRDGGSAPEFAIVGGGPNGAFPHHHTGPRPLRDGDAVVIDIGGRLDGYVSDITRMAFIGEPTGRYREIHAIVEAAVVAGMAAAKPGATCAEVDAAARGVIADAGYGDYFVHRTGHGLGLSVHEPPWIMRGYDVELRPGVVHSVEPGIYLPGEFGVRLEEIVHVTETGCERFSSLPRDVHVVAGQQQPQYDVRDVPSNP